MGRKDGKRRCTAQTKSGTRCRNVALKGEKVCLAHASRKVKERAGFGGPQEGSGRPKMPTPTDVARRLIEDNIAVILDPHFRALGYTVDLDKETGTLELFETEEGPAKIHGESKEGIIKMSPYDNLGTMMGAAEKLLDRVYGRPKSVSESKVEVTSRNQMDREIESLMEEMNGRDARAGAR